MTEPQESARPSDVVERARQAVDAWDRFAAWAPTRVPGVRVCLDLVRDLLAEVERLRDDLRVEGLIHHQCESVDDEVERLRTDLARMTERAEGAEVAWQDTITERDEALAAIERVRVALSNHPRCDRHPDGGPVTCGWKRAVIDVQHALDGGDSQ